MRLRFSVRRVRDCMIFSLVQGVSLDVCREGEQGACQRGGAAGWGRVARARRGVIPNKHATGEGRLQGVLFAGDVARCGGATLRRVGTLMAALAVVLGLSAGRVHAAGEAAGDDGRPPSPAATMAAYRLVESWVRAWETPADAGAAGLERIGEDGAIGGAAVTLRLAGRVIGRGSDLGGGAESVWRAARQAMAEADRRLPRGSGLLAEEALRETTGQVMISLELAGQPLAIVPTPATYSDAAVALAPGLDGVAVRLGAAGRVGAVFPGRMLASNMLGGTALSQAAAEAGGDAALGLVEPKELVERHGASLLRFRVSHLAQTSPGQPPVFLERGRRVVEVGEMTAGALREMADRLYGHLRARMRDINGASQVYEPWRDAVSGAPLTSAEVALVGYAAGRYAALSHVDRSAGEEAAAWAGEVLWRAQRHAEGAALKGVEGAIAAALLAASGETLSEAALGLLREAYTREDGFAERVPPAARGAIALGLVRAAAESDEMREVAERAVRAAFRETPEGQLVSQMPWLGWAEVGLARGEDVPAAVALRRMRERVWEHQLTAAVAGRDDLDLVGGIVFTKGRTAIPTWQAARPLAFIATMLGDGRLTEEGEFNSELVRLLTSLRFLRQLQVDESAMWMYPNPELAMGGIRASVWDQRMPIEASALTLLAVCETLEALEKKAGE